MPELQHFIELWSSSVKSSRAMRCEILGCPVLPKAFLKKVRCLQSRLTWGCAKSLIGTQGPERPAIDTQLVQIQAEPGPTPLSGRKTATP